MQFPAMSNLTLDALWNAKILFLFACIFLQVVKIDKAKHKANVGNKDAAGLERPESK